MPGQGLCQLHAVICETGRDSTAELRIIAVTTRLAVQALRILLFLLILRSTMGPLRVTEHQSGYLGTCVASCVLVVAALLSPVVVLSQDLADSATLQGSVHDSRGRPVVAATVTLLGGAGTETLIQHTDAEGNYRFERLHAGNYNLHAELAGYGQATAARLILEQKEAKKVDLTLAPPTASTAQVSSSGTLESGGPRAKPEFFDEPEFTVAGVTDSTNLGGHGSNTVVRTREALAKDIVGLNTTPASPASDGATEKSLRETAKREPGNFDANHRLGKLLVDNGKGREAIPYLERASRLSPGDYGNSYELSLAYADAGKYESARARVRTLLTLQDTAVPDKGGQGKAELHHLLGDVEEKLGNSLEAVREYQLAAELDPSESNLFDWGAELLMHRAAEPAIEVFTKGNRLFPRSARMLVGLGIAWYARGSYDQAAQRLCEASDLNPDDPNPYLFIGKMQSAGSSHSQCLVERLERFARLQPENALANYYCGLSLWKRREGPDDAQASAQAESLLEKAVHLDPKLGVGHLQLGILYAERQDFPRAISSYQKASAASPGLEEAHYRLAQAYRRTGEKLKAQEELQLYEQISKKKEEEIDRERREIRQFVYTLRDRTLAVQPPE